MAHHSVQVALSFCKFASLGHPWAFHTLMFCLIQCPHESVVLPLLFRPHSLHSGTRHSLHVDGVDLHRMFMGYLRMHFEIAE